MFDNQVLVIEWPIKLFHNDANKNKLLYNMHMGERTVILLAAGRGSRLNLEVPKSMAPLGSRPVLDHTIRHLTSTQLGKPVCVIGHLGETIKDYYCGDVIYRRQPVLNGNAGAILAAADVIPIFGNCMIVQGDDSSFVSPETFLDVYRTHEVSGAKVTAMLSPVYDPETQNRYCVVNCNGEIGSCRRIDKTRGKPDGGFFTGVYCFESEFLLEGLSRLVTDSTGEMGIPQLIDMALLRRVKVMSVWDKKQEWMSINTQKQLLLANQRFSLSNS